MSSTGLALGSTGALAAGCHAIKELSSMPAPQGPRLAAAVEGNELPYDAEKLPQQKSPNPPVAATSQDLVDSFSAPSLPTIHGRSSPIPASQV